jgi:Phage integrase family
VALLPYYAGLRDSEAVRLDIGDVRLSARKGELQVLGKGADGGKQRTLPVHAELRSALQAWLQERRRWPGAEHGPALVLNQRGGRLSDRSVRTIMGYDPRLLAAELEIGSREAVFLGRFLAWAAKPAQLTGPTLASDRRASRRGRLAACPPARAAAPRARGRFASRPGCRRRDRLPALPAGALTVAAGLALMALLGLAWSRPWSSCCRQPAAADAAGRHCGGRSAARGRVRRRAAGADLSGPVPCRRHPGRRGRLPGPPHRRRAGARPPPPAGGRRPSRRP